MLNLMDYVKVVDNEANQKRYEEYGEEFQIGGKAQILGIEDDCYDIVIGEMMTGMEKPLFKVGFDDVEFFEHNKKD